MNLVYNSSTLIVGNSSISGFKSTVYCPYCDAKREVNRGKEAREAFCQCGNQMFYKNEYLHEKGRSRTIGKEKLPEIEQVPF